MERFEQRGDESMLEDVGGERMEGEVLDKYKVENSKREAFKFRDAPL